MDEFSLTTEPISEPAPETNLPRSPWSSQLTQLRIILQAKQALDRQEMSLFLQAQRSIAVPERMKYTPTERSLAAYELRQLTCTSSA